MTHALDLTTLEAASLKDAVDQAYGILGELDKGLGLLHLLLAEGDHAGHLGLEAMVALWSRAVRSVLDEKSDAIEATIKLLGKAAKQENAV